MIRKNKQTNKRLNKNALAAFCDKKTIKINTNKLNQA